LARLVERAAKMGEQGYTLRAWGGGYAVYRPASAVQEGEVSGYAVDLDSAKKSCTCPDFLNHGDMCKHLLFALNLLDEQADFDAEEWAAERYR
jgi:hypothetical protein